MNQTAFLFPGQGSQIVGMGLDLYQEYADVREIFDMAEDICKTRLTRLCFNGPMEDLTRTAVLQPALTAINLSLLRVITREGIAPSWTAGHSLGEFAALTCAGVITPESALTLVHRRGTLMHRESLRFEGAMSAVMGLSIEAVDEIVRQIDAHLTFPRALTVANHNSETQIVISGDPASVAEAGAEIKARRGRAIPLKVSGAWHSPLIRGAEEEFGSLLQAVAVSAPERGMLFNVTADECRDPDGIRQIMRDQLCRPVRWYDSMQSLIERGVTTFVEVGPGNVLSGLMKKILPDNFQGQLYTVGDMKSLELFFKDVI
ncbi:ACP S-malonyltransferase [Desulfatiferula olefinivorans]